ncbi:MAG TPA: two pore domain potassium channel family protein, partial [Thermoanaerobaculia bacterium]|nr:two pore domain potassium channel family protein [Thermoanaerobaculia bacterium]
MWLTAAGILVLTAGTIDLGWTTLGTHGGGPMSSWLTKGIWKVMLAIHRRKPLHKVLSFGGSIILLALIAFWVVLIWGGWLLIFSGDPSSIITTSTHHGVDWAARVYFVGSTMFTAGTTQYAPNGRGWQIASAVLNGSGLFVATLAITYLLAVLGAIVEKRSTASFMWDMGGTPQRIMERA